jgi:hypothetical protein
MSSRQIVINVPEQVLLAEQTDATSLLFTEIWTPMAVVHELLEGRRKGYDVPNPADYAWISIVEPRSIPSQWLTLDLGAGELAALALGLDDGLARHIA